MVEQHAAGGRVTVRCSDGTAFRVAVGALPQGHLAQRCLAVLLEVLPGPLWHLLYSAFVSHSGERPCSFYGLLPLLLELECHTSRSLLLPHLHCTVPHLRSLPFRP